MWLGVLDKVGRKVRGLKLGGRVIEDVSLEDGNGSLGVTSWKSADNTVVRAVISDSETPSLKEIVTKTAERVDGEGF